MFSALPKEAMPSAIASADTIGEHASAIVYPDISVIKQEQCFFQKLNVDHARIEAFRGMKLFINIILVQVMVF